jgi:hypothetical protein
MESWTLQEQIGRKHGSYHGGPLFNNCCKLNMELKQQLVQAISILFHAQWLIETSGR